MKRFSQRNPLVTLSDINVTPLLDLAFVLLIIFVITTQSLEQGMDLTLPEGGRPDQSQLKKEDIQTVEIGKTQGYMLNSKPMTLEQMETALVKEYRENPNMLVYIRADKEAPVERLFAVTEMCVNHNITRFNWRSSPPSGQP